jgi:superfamily I DNA and/or RNA helicase
LSKTIVECTEKRQRTSVGIISPYTAQVIALRSMTFYLLRVKSIDGFHGGEEDIILISTVWSNKDGKIGSLILRESTWLSQEPSILP